MRIQQADNHDLIRRLFSDYKQGRIRDMNARIEGETAISPRANLHTLSGGHTPFASWDDAMSEMNPNHIRGLVTVQGGPGPDHRMIDLPDHMREAMITFAREDFTRNFGGSRDSVNSGERQTMLQHSFLRELPEQDRQAANWTLQQIRFDESERIHNAVRQALPNWQIGQRVPDNILTPILNGAGGFSAMA